MDDDEDGLSDAEWAAWQEALKDLRTLEVTNLEAQLHEYRVICARLELVCQRLLEAVGPGPAADGASAELAALRARLRRPKGR